MIHSESHTTEKGNLSSIHVPPHLPAFPVRRIFMIEGIEGVLRGQHAHRTCWQYIIFISGEWEYRIESKKAREQGGRSSYMNMMIVEPGSWVTLKPLETGAKAIVLCDKEYDPKDYITDRKEFEEMRSKL